MLVKVCSTNLAVEQRDFLTKKNILTFNHHESYIASLGQTGHNFEVVTRYKDLDLSWSPLARPMPGNFCARDFDEALKAKIQEGSYDIIIAHTIKNLIWLFPFFKASYVFIAHIPLYWNSPLATLKSIFKWLILALFRLTHKTEFVAVSQYKANSWSQGARVIDLCALPFERSIKLDYSRIKPVLVANKIASRGDELGYSSLKALMDASTDLRIIGNNPDIKGALTPKSFEEFVDYFSNGNVYVFTISQPWGDGYNTAMLEAMNLGMTIVTLANPSSPIDHEVNGLIAHEGLMKEIEYLRAHPEKLKTLGENARKTIEDKFSLKKFIQAWNQLFLAIPSIR